MSETYVTGFQCNLCPCMFTTTEALVKHVKMCERSHNVCPVCGKRFIQKSGLQSHLQFHRNRHRYIECAHCCRTFKAEHNLTVHINQYHPEKAIKPRCYPRKIIIPQRKRSPPPPEIGFHLPPGVRKEGNVYHCSTPPPTVVAPQIDVRSFLRFAANGRREWFAPPTFPVKCETVTDRLPDIADYFKTK